MNTLLTASTSVNNSITSSDMIKINQVISTLSQIQKESTAGIQKESTKEIQKESTKEIQKESTKEIQKESTKEIQKESTTEIQKESTECKNNYLSHKIDQIKPLYNVDIDFDEASRAWRANKKRIKGMLYYKCCYRHSNGKRCNNIINPPVNKYALYMSDEKKKVNKSKVFCHQHKNRIYCSSIYTWW